MRAETAAPVPARTRLPETMTSWKAGSLRRTTTPGTPSSRTSMLQPQPRTRSGMRSWKQQRTRAESSSRERGWASISAGPPSRR